MAIDTWRIGEIDAYVVKHCSSFKLVHVHFKVFARSNFKGQISYLTGVCNIYIPQARACGI